MSGKICGPVLYLANIRRSPGRTKHLFPLLNDSRTRKVTNPADHVFAVLGMADEMKTLDRSPASCDYEKPVARVFKDATWLIILFPPDASTLTVVEITDYLTISELSVLGPCLVVASPNIRIYMELLHENLEQAVSLGFETSGILGISDYRLESVKAVSRERVNVSQSTKVKVEGHYPPRLAEIEFVDSAWALLRTFQTVDPTAGGESTNFRA